MVNSNANLYKMFQDKVSLGQVLEALSKSSRANSPEFLETGFHGIHSQVWKEVSFITDGWIGLDVFKFG